MAERQRVSEERTGNVPLALSSFVGRTSLLAELRERLTAARLITLTGVGGAGKTRLALELARQQAAAYDDGVWLAELAPVDDPEMLVQTVLSAVGVPDQSTRQPLSTLVEYVRHKQMLLVLDNCEHVVGPAGRLVATLLRAAPGLTIVATSRTLLEVSGETVVPVPPMTVPASVDEPMPTAPGQEYESVALFAARAESRAPRWQITPANWPQIVRILQRLDGIPLAIELTTVRLRSMSLDELAQRMDDALDPGHLMKLLTRNDTTVLPHHETLHAVITWSHDLCTPTERVLWSRASVFAGTFTLAAAEAVCAGDELAVGDMVDALDGLVTSSVVETTASRGRYWLLEPMRQYGAMRSAERGEQALMRQRHRDYYRDVAARAVATCYGPDEIDILHEIGRDMPNYRSVMSAYLAEPDRAQTGLQVAISLARSRYFFFAGTMPEGIRWLERILEATPDADPLMRAGARAMDVWIDLCTGTDHEHAWSRLEEAAALVAGLGVDFPPVTQVQGVYWIWVHSDPSGITVLRDAHAQFRELGPDFHQDGTMALILMTIGAVLLGDEQQARETAAVTLRETQREQSPWPMTWAMWCQGIADVRFGDPERAVQTLLATLRTQRELGDRWGPIWSIEVLAWAHARLGDARRAAVLLGAASALHTLTAVRVSQLVPFAAYRQVAEQEAQQALGAADYKAAVAVGARIQSYDEAVALVEQQSAALTSTQLIVAQLVATGLSNKDIAEKLVISLRTVESHVSAILRRLGATNRREIMIWVAQHLA